MTPALNNYTQYKITEHRNMQKTEDQRRFLY